MSCLAVIEKNGLEDIIILFGRGYSNSYINLASFNVIHLPKLITDLDKIPTTGINKPIWINKRLSAIDTLLSESIKESCCCYLPHTNNYLMQAIITHSKCTEYNIIDEGLLNYSHPQFFIKKTNPLYTQQFILKRALRYFSHFNRSIVFTSINAKLNTIYLFNRSDFENSNYKITKINFPLLNLDLKSMSNQHVFVFDNSIQDQVIEEDAFFKLLNEIFSTLKVDKLYVKYHPAQSNIDQINSLLLKLNVRFEILPIDKPLELVFIQSENMKIYGIWSSLLFYASVSGHTVYSYCDTAGRLSDKAKKWTEGHIPDSFYRSIELR